MSTVKSPLHILAALVSAQLEPRTLSPEETQAVVSLALRHGLGPMLQRTVKRAGIDTADPVWTPLVTTAHKAVVRYLQLKSAQASAQAALAAADIPAIWLKGFALAHTIYPHPALRPMVDLDVLVPFAQREAALEVVRSVGYCTAAPLLHDSLREAEHHYKLRHNAADAVSLELHYRLLVWSDKLLPLPRLEWFWQQMRCYSGHGVEFSSFTPEAHLLHLCVHNVLQHGGHTLLLRRYLDLHLLITHYPTLNWQLVTNQAVALEWTYAVEQALTVTQEYFATRLPDDFLTALDHRRSAQEDTSRVTRRQSPNNVVVRYLNSLADMHWSSAVRLIVGVLVPSPAYMRWRYRIDASWKLPFYYLYRWLDPHKWRTR